jgi:hypothetical protein
MPSAEPVTREAILRTLTEALKPLSYIDAFWEAGAAAFRRVDEWSDLDLYAVVAEDKIDDTFRVVEESLARLSPIARKFEPIWPPESGTAQRFYRLERASEYLLVDLAIFKRSAKDKLLEPELHGEAVFLFNKGDAVKPPSLDTEDFIAKLLERRDRLVLRTELFGPFVLKEIQRRNWLEALDVYRVLVLDALVQVLRMRYHPVHHGFKMRYVHYELPPEVVKRLQDLSFVRNPFELGTKHRAAIDWFNKVAAEITEEETRAQLRRG